MTQDLPLPSIDTRLLIGGQRMPGLGAVEPILDPATGEQIASVA